MILTEAEKLQNSSGSIYIRLAGTKLTTTTTDNIITAKKSYVENELLANWYCLDLVAEKAILAKSASAETQKMTNDKIYEINKDLSGEGIIKTTDKYSFDYLVDTFHNKLCDIAMYNPESARAQVVYSVPFLCDIDMTSQASASVPYTYKKNGSFTTVKDSFTILELVTASNLPIVETVQCEDDGSGTAGLLGKINSCGTDANSAVATVTAAGFVMSKTVNPPTTGDTVVDGTRVITGYMFKEAVTAAAGTWYVRAYATNAAGTSYGKVITMATT